MIELTIFGPPIAYTAPRVTRRGNTYNPKQKEKNSSRSQIEDQYEGAALESPVSVAIEFSFPIPASFSKADKKAIQDHTHRHAKKPDIDNCIKFVLDAIKGIVIKDDNQVDVIWARKTYSATPQTVIKVMK